MLVLKGEKFKQKTINCLPRGFLYNICLLSVHLFRSATKYNEDF